MQTNIYGEHLPELGIPNPNQLELLEQWGGCRRSRGVPARAQPRERSSRGSRAAQFIFCGTLLTAQYFILVPKVIDKTGS